MPGKKIQVLIEIAVVGRIQLVKVFKSFNIRIKELATKRSPCPDCVRDVSGYRRPVSSPTVRPGPHVPVPFRGSSAHPSPQPSSTHPSSPVTRPCQPWLIPASISDPCDPSQDWTIIGLPVSSYPPHVGSPPPHSPRRLILCPAESVDDTVCSSGG